MTVKDSELKKFRIGILMGGCPKFNLERIHSMDYGRTIFSILKKASYNVIPIEIKNRFQIDTLLNEKIDLVFNALIGRFGEGGSLQSLLEYFRIPYTGSGPLASMIAMDKYKFKLLIKSLNIPTPNFQIINFKNWKKTPLTDSSNSHIYNNIFLTNKKNLRIKPPIFVKSNSGAFSIGSSIVYDVNELDQALIDAQKVDDLIIIEDLINGIDAHVPILNGQALTPIEKQKLDTIKHNEKLSSFSFKIRSSQYIIPGRFSKSIMSQLIHYSETAYNALGCRGLCRADFRVSQSGKVNMLEMNTQHSIRDKSMAIMSAKASGLSALKLTKKVLTNCWRP